MANDSDRTRLTIDISGDLNARLEAIARDLGTSKTEIIKRSLALMDYVNAQKNEGKRLAISTDGKTVQTEVVFM